MVFYGYSLDNNVSNVGPNASRRSCCFRENFSASHYFARIQACDRTSKFCLVTNSTDSVNLYRYTDLSMHWYALNAFEDGQLQPAGMIEYDIDCKCHDLASHASKYVFACLYVNISISIIRQNPGIREACYRETPHTYRLIRGWSLFVQESYHMP